MREYQLQSGYIEGMEKPYIFTYDGELLQLIPQDKDSIKIYDSLANKNVNMELLEGTTIQNNKIFFLNCQLKVYSSGYTAKPAGYICFDKDNCSFDTVTFRGGIIDFFYRPNHIIDEENTKYNYNDGGGEIRLKPFDDISKECEIDIDGKRAKLLLSVTLPSEPIYMKTDYTLGKPQSILQLKFEEKIDVTEFRKMYMWIYNFMSFVSFNKNISLGKVNMGRINENKKIEEIAYVYLNEKNKEEIEDVDNIIGYFFVWDKLNELMHIVNLDDLNLLVIPQNAKDSKYLTSEKYMICCTSFESVFNHVFPNAKTEYSQITNEVKEEFLDFIKLKDQEYSGKSPKKRIEFKKYADMIKFLDFGLAEKYSFCQKKFDKEIKNFSTILYTRFHTKEINDIDQKFAKKRNLLMHSSLGEFEDAHIIAYNMARAFTYIMLLKKVEIESDLVIQGIEKIIL